MKNSRSERSSKTFNFDVRTIDSVTPNTYEFITKYVHHNSAASCRYKFFVPCCIPCTVIFKFVRCCQIRMFPYEWSPSVNCEPFFIHFTILCLCDIPCITYTAFNYSCHGTQKYGTRKLVTNVLPTKSLCLIKRTTITSIEINGQLTFIFINIFNLS